MGPGDLARGDGAIKTAALTGKAREAGERVRPLDMAGATLLISKPGIVSGVAVAGLAGMVLAARGFPGAATVLPCLLVIVGAAAGSAIINGLLDAPADASMPRLSGRVAAMRKVGGGAALALSVGLIIASLIAAWLLFPGAAPVLLLAAVLSYTLLYTLVLKRRSPYGTIPGGIPGALPVLIGYAAVAGRIGADGVILFLVMILWQPPHFWTLALAHAEEYRNAGIPVLPVVMGEEYTKILVFLYAVSLLPSTLALWAFGYCSAAFAWVAAGLWCFFLFACYRNAVRRPRFRRAFGASILYIVGILLAVIVDVAVRSA